MSTYPAHTLTPLRVLPARHEIMWRDGTTLGLHPVAGPAGTEMFLRAVHGPGGCTVFDLRRLSEGAQLETDLKTLQPRDHPGCIFFSLRLAYRTAAACLQAIQASALCVLELQREAA